MCTGYRTRRGNARRRCPSLATAWSASPTHQLPCCAMTRAAAIGSSTSLTCAARCAHAPLLDCTLLISLGEISGCKSGHRGKKRVLLEKGMSNPGFKARTLHLLVQSATCRRLRSSGQLSIQCLLISVYLTDRSHLNGVACQL